MDAQIEHLVKLQAVDLERARLTLAARALPAEITQAESALANARKQATEASDALSREETLRSRLEREIAGHRQKAARYKEQQDSVTTPEQADAIEHELGFAQSEAARLEAEEFQSLERTEKQEAALAAARAKVEEEAQTLEKTRERVAEKQKELAAEQATLQTKRDALRKHVKEELLTRYDRISLSRGTGLARVDNQQCVGCRMGVRPQMWNELREGLLLTCDSCGRLLYWDPALAPAPKAPQPVPAAGTGRAVRKKRVVEA